jgi:hypothetical protein
VIVGAALLIYTACSPEARRVRDGGPGADPGNKFLVEHAALDPHAADTTLWPGRAAAPVDLLAKGVIAPPSYPPPGQAPRVPPSQKRSSDHDRSGDRGHP